MILEDAISIRAQFYEDWALLMNQENNSILPTVARGLSSILFAINIDNVDLNSGSDYLDHNGKVRSEPVPVILGTSVNGIMESSRGKPSRKVVAPRVVSFDDDPNDYDRLSLASAHSAPATCLPSPNTPENASSASWLRREPSECPSDFETSGSVGTNLLLTPVGDQDNTSVGELAIHSESDEPSPSPGNHSEMKQTVTYIMQRKNSLQDKTSSLVSLLQKQKDETERTKAEFNVSKHKYEEQLKRSEAQQESTSKENSILKIQLKKYISAIQMLKQEGKPQFQSSQSGDEATNSNDMSITSQSSYSYYKEINEYEKKLVQVAEMHGELVEFNDRLHRVISQKESVIKRLREELVELRGPVRPSFGNFIFSFPYVFLSHIVSRRQSR